MYKRVIKGTGFLTSPYVMALLAPAVVSGAMQVTWPFFEHNPIALYLLAVMFSAWYGGLGPGLLCVAVSYLLSDLFFVEPYSLFQFHKSGDLVRVVLFVIIGPTISLLSELMHRERQRAGINLESAKCAERLLREKERFANQIAELSPFVIIVFDVAMSRDIYISPDVVNLIGYTPKEMQEMDDVFSVLGHPEDISGVRENLARLKQARNGEIIEFEYRIRRRDGEWRWVATRGISFARDEHGEVRQIVTASLDITERKRAEEALRESEERYRIVSETAAEAIITIDEGSTILFVNPSTEHIFGYSAKEMLGKQLSVLMPEYLRPVHKAGLNRYIETSRKHMSWTGTELPGLHKSGREIPLEVSFSEAVKNGHHYFTGIARDVTNRKRAEQALRQSEQDFRNLFEQAHDAIIVFDPEHEIVLDVNERACEVYGFTRSEFIGMSLQAISKDVVRGKNKISKTQERGHYLNFETVQYRKDGTEMFLEVNASKILYQGQLVILSINRDITERKRAEEKLRQSESQLAEAQRLASLGSWNWDLRNNINTWSDELYRIFGLDPQGSEPSYNTFIELVHPDDRTLASGALEHALKTQEPINSYLRIVRPDGAERIIHSRGNTINNGSGIPIRMHGTSQDVTERTQAEKALREAEQRYRDIFENAGEGIFQSTPDGKLLAANPAMAHMYGFASPEEVIHTLQDIARQHYVDSSRREEFKRQIEEYDSVRGFEHQVFRKDGSKIWVSANAHAVRDAQGAIRYYEGTVQDITDRKLAEEALRESEERYRDLVENSLELICTHDLDGVILSANRAAIEIMGYSPDCYPTGRNLREILAPEARSQFDDYLKRIRTDGVARGLMLAQTATGEKRIWKYHNTLRTQGVSTPVVRGMARDITERRLTNQSLKLFRTLIDRSSDAIEVIDPTTLHFLDCNKIAYQDLGYSREEFLSLTVYDIDPLMDEKMNAWIIEETERLGGVTFESIHRRKDGSTFPVEINLKIVRFERNYRLAVVRDITERKRAEAFLASEKRVLEMIAGGRQLPDILDALTRLVEKESKGLSCSILLLDADGVHLRHGAAPSLPDAYCRRIDGSPIGPSAASCGTAAFRKELVVVEDVATDPLWEDYRALALEHGLRACWSTPILTADRSLLGTFAMYYREPRRPGPKDLELIERATHLAAIAIERQQAEHALRQAEQKYRELFENAKEAIYVHDLNGKYTSLNRAAEQLTGYLREEILGKHFSSFIAPEYEEGVRENLCRKLLEKGETIYEIEIVTKDGRRVPVEISSRLIYEEDVAVGVQGTVHNTVERKRAEEALRGYSRQLIKAQEAERQRISRELHDQIGQVLTAIRINLETIRDSEHQAESKALIDEGVAIVDQAIQQVRDLSFELRPSLLDNLGLVAALRWYSDQYTKRTGIRTRSVTNLRGSQTRLNQDLETACFRIVQEALTNVVRHANAKNVSIDLSKLDHKIVLSIKDDGIGFDQSANGASSATRLGLRGMKERALAVGGTLKIESAPAQGTEIRALFPTKSTED